MLAFALVAALLIQRAYLQGAITDNTDEAFVVGPEAGFKFYALQKTFILGQMEYQFAFEDVDDADEAADDGQFVYTLGIGFNF